MPSSPMSARAAAIALLDAVIGERRLLSDLVQGPLLNGLSPPERASAQRLATETLRGLERADRLISRHVRKKPPLSVRNALRLGTVELCTGGDAHGVLHELVGLIGQNRRYSRLKGLVNAVLRKIADEGPGCWNDLRTPRLSRWLRDPLVQAWGNGAVSAIEATHYKGAPLDITTKADADALAEQLSGDLLPTGSIRLAEPGQVSRLPGYEEGDWWVQDAAAALPVKLLAPRSGEKVLDLCAAPGGKTLQLAATSASVTALDISERRMKRVQENLARTTLSANCLVEDALEHDGGPYDAILLDAPCSATGTIRRHPDLPYTKDGSDFGSLIELQAQMIDHAVTLLKPGGRLVFCTCSLLPDEGECQIEEAILRHSNLVVDRDALKQDWIESSWLSEEGGLRLRPDFWTDRGGMDGFYMAVCVKENS